MHLSLRRRSPIFQHKKRGRKWEHPRTKKKGTGGSEKKMWGDKTELFKARDCGKKKDNEEGIWVR